MKRDDHMLRENNQAYYGLMTEIKRKHTTQSEVAKKLGMSQSNFNNKIVRKNGRDFQLHEAKEIEDLLHISTNDFY